MALTFVCHKNLFGTAILGRLFCPAFQLLGQLCSKCILLPFLQIFQLVECAIIFILTVKWNIGSLFWIRQFADSLQISFGTISQSNGRKIYAILLVWRFFFVNRLYRNYLEKGKFVWISYIWQPLLIHNPLF